MAFKYNLEDKIFFLNENKLKSGVIVARLRVDHVNKLDNRWYKHKLPIQAFSNNRIAYSVVTENDGMIVEEENAFPSKEELLASL